jgi:copper resistance protein B
MNRQTTIRPAAVLLGAVFLVTSPTMAAEPEAASPVHEQEQDQHEHGSMPMEAGMEEGHDLEGDQPARDGAESISLGMDMGAMQGGRAPADARDPNAWADGYEYTGMPGFEQTDQMAIGLFLLDEFEFVSGNEGDGGAWSLQAAYGGDTNRFWLRSQGLKVGGQPVDSETTAELLWWRGYAPFWGSVMGVRQDFGTGAHTWAAFGVEGLAPYRFEIQATGYVGDDGRLAARFKASYDLLFTNRLILAPSFESNAYSRSEPERGLGSGVSNVEFGLRLRYEVRRKFAPYIGYVWERSLGDTADFARADDEPVNEHRLVAGVRLWW